MNKVISTNIGGLVFNLDENAYESLMQYLNALKQNLAHINNNEEILSDIEMRIAELLRENQNDFKEVITLIEVDNVIALLGDPKDYVDDDAFEANQKEKTAEGKKFFRDPDDSMVAGVCAGIANYFRIDVTIVRIIAVVLLVFGGFAIPLYIILWLVSPKAISSADKLKMKGEPITVENIKKEVKEASERIKNSKFTKNISEKIEKKAPSFFRKIKQFFGIATIIGVFFVSLFFYFFIFGEYGYFINDGEEIYSFQQLSDLIFIGNTQITLGWMAFLIIFIAPLLGLLLFGCRLLLHSKNKWIRKVNFGLFFLWLIGIAMAVIVSLQIGRGFTHQITHQHSVANAQLDTLTIEVEEQNKTLSKNWQDDDRKFLFVSHNTIRSNNLEVEISSSKDSLVHVYTVSKAYGKSDAKASKRASNIKSKINYANGKLTVFPSIYFPYTDKFRGQELTLMIALPKNTAIQWKGNKNRLDFDTYDYTQLTINENGVRFEYNED